MGRSGGAGLRSFESRASCAQAGPSGFRRQSVTIGPARVRKSPRPDRERGSILRARVTQGSRRPPRCRQSRASSMFPSDASRPTAPR